MNERDIFIGAMQQEDASQRLAYLDDACGNDGGLRERVAALLLVHDRAGSYLDQPAVEPLGTQMHVLSRNDSDEGPGTKIGPYKLLQPIGEGGMGTVFMAEQSHPIQRKVAVKVIKPGMDSKQVVARFEAERQALALMDHPHIAKVLDAGTTERGRPYFVMELVKGIPIMQYCDERHLKPRERLELFVPVCQAVQHAHQKGIIHRDLKPSNILIALYDGKPVPKVIDFGVAKATGPKLTERTLFTEFGSIVGTLEYMSPEQAEINQLDVDTRSDIYSLGVLLYELLTGTTPLERKRLKATSILEALRLIREEEPQKPSTRLSTAQGLPTIAANRGLEAKKLPGIVRGELDWIVLKCLEKDRSRRYETANGLAMDLQRYLNDEPVQACPPSWRYRLGKGVRRNKGPVVTALLLAAALVVGTVLVWQQRQEALSQRDVAREQRQRAQDNLDRARKAVNESFTLLSESTLINHPNLEPLRKELLLSAMRYYEEFVRDHGDDPALQAELVAACFRITNMIYALGAEEDWLTPFEKGVEVMEDLMRKKPDLAALSSLQAGIFRPMATYWPTPKPAEALRAFQKARDLWEPLVREHPQVHGFQNDLGYFHGLIGFVHLRMRQPAESVRSFRQARDLARQIAAANPRNPRYRVALVMSLALLQEDLPRLGLLAEAEEADRQALEAVEKLAADYPGVPYYQELLAWTWECLGVGREGRGQPREEEAAARQVLAAYEKLAREFPAVARYRNRLLSAQRHLAELLWSTGRRAEAAEFYRQFSQLTERVSKEDAAGHDVRAWFLANCPDPQFRDPRRAVELAKRAVELAPKEGGWWNTLGVAHYRASNWQEAIKALNQAVQLAEGDSWDYFFLAMAHWQHGDKAEARKWFDKAVAWMEKYEPRSRELRRFRSEAETVLGITTNGKHK